MTNNANNQCKQSVVNNKSLSTHDPHLHGYYAICKNMHILRENNVRKNMIV